MPYGLHFILFESASRYKRNFDLKFVKLFSASAEDDKALEKSWFMECFSFFAFCFVSFFLYLAESQATL